MIIGKKIKKVVGVDLIEGTEHFALLWEKPANRLDIEGIPGLDGTFEIVGLVLTPAMSRADLKKRKKKSLDKQVEK